MLAGYLDHAEHRYIEGWAVDHDDLGKRVALRVNVSGRDVVVVHADQLREDLRAQGWAGDGRHGFRYYFETPLPLTDTHRVTVRFLETGALLRSGNVLINPRPIRRLDPLRPLLVTSAGRSGSTLLMRWLGDDPAVAMVDQYPYEMKLTAYYAKAYDVLTLPGNPARSVAAEMIYDDPFHLGFNPFHHADFAGALTQRDGLSDFFVDFSGPVIAEAFKTIITGFYQRLMLDQCKCGALYFAEKCSIFDPVRNFVRAVYPDLREIVLIRDPRDIVCSYQSFWHTSAEDAQRTLMTFRAKALDIREAAPGDVLLLRYEDMLRDPASTRARIGEFLGLRRALAKGAALAEREIFAGHATSRSPAASVGRWQRDLPLENIAKLAATFGDFLTAFGYDEPVATDSAAQAPKLPA